ncbi:MAG: hypothetical protein AAF581_10965 [Planctomycetota bacterium]
MAKKRKKLVLEASDWIRSGAVCRSLGICHLTLDDLVKNEVLIPIVTTLGKHKNERRFRRGDVDAYKARLEAKAGLPPLEEAE